MSINDLAAKFGDACYLFLGLNFLWGLYNVIMGFRRVRELAFGGHEEQAEFVDEIMPLLEAGKFAEAREIYEPLLAKYPEAWQIEPLIARTYAGENKLDEAAAHLRTALQHDPANI